MVTNISINLSDFCPWNRWSPPKKEDISKEFDEHSFIYTFSYKDLFEKDLRSNRIYLNQENSTLRGKNIGLMIWSCAAHIIKAAHRAFNMMTVYYFSESKSKPLKNKVALLVKDIAKIAATPLVIIALEISAVYGLINPKDGRKLFASFERLFHTKFGMDGLDLFGRSPAYPYCAPCYQPDFMHKEPPCLSGACEGCSYLVENPHFAH